MCGVIAYCEQPSSALDLLGGLNRREYRGHDPAEIALQCSLVACQKQGGRTPTTSGPESFAGLSMRVVSLIVQIGLDT